MQDHFFLKDLIYVKCLAHSRFYKRTGIPHFIVLCIAALSRYCNFINMEATHSTAKRLAHGKPG